MKSKLTIIICLFFVFTGSVINFIFYLKFFANTNYDPWVYIIISVIFTGITAILYYQGFRKHIKWIVIAAALISLFSIFCSTAGQFADSQEKININIDRIEDINKNQTTLDRAWKEIDRINEAWQKLEDQKNIDSVEKRYNWKNTTKSIEDRQDELIKEKKFYESIVYNKKDAENIVIEKYAADIFDQISTSVDQKIIIQLIFEILISVIIEIIAPLALYIMTIKDKNNENIKQNDKNKQSKPVKRSFEELVRLYADCRFDGGEILKGWPSVNGKMSKNIFDHLTKLAIRKGLIYIDGKIAKIPLFVDKKGFIESMILKEKI